MQAILKYKLPDEKEDFELALKAHDYNCVLWDLDQMLRSKIKYDDQLTEDQYHVYESVRQHLHDLLNSRGLEL